MSGSEPDSGDIFDIRNFEQLVKLMRDHELNEVDLKRGDRRIRLRRGGEQVIVSSSAPAAAPRAAQPGPAPATAPSSDGASEAAAADQKLHYIKSPMVGTFYVASSPEAAPFVKVGDQVGPDTTVCIVEAMKLFNEVPAECSGKVAKVLVANGDPVEFNQPLFAIET